MHACSSAVCVCICVGVFLRCKSYSTIKYYVQVVENKRGTVGPSHTGWLNTSRKLHYFNSSKVKFTASENMMTTTWSIIFIMFKTWWCDVGSRVMVKTVVLSVVRCHVPHLLHNLITSACCCNKSKKNTCSQIKVQHRTKIKTPYLSPNRLPDESVETLFPTFSCSL